MFCMPKINAPTVAEHRAGVLDKLITAAEETLRTDGVAGLTAKVVCERAGIARNGLYRYVSSVDELPGLVIGRYLPQWNEAITTAVAEHSSPRERLLAWVSASLEQAATTGHGWLMTLPVTPHTSDAVDQAHGELMGTVRKEWEALCPSHADGLTSATIALVSNGFTQLERGVPAAEVEAVIRGSVEAMVEAFGA